MTKQKTVQKSNIEQKKKFKIKKKYIAKIEKTILGKNLQKKPEDGTEIFKYKVNILVKQHNVFCSLATTKDNKTLHNCSSGKYKIKMSKKILTYTYY